MSADKDTHGATRKKAIVTVGVSFHVPNADFASNLSRVTLLVPSMLRVSVFYLYGYLRDAYSVPS